MDLKRREAELAAKERELQMVMATVRVALGMLSSKALAFTSMLASIAAFGWAVYEPHGWRIAASALFTVIVFLPALWADVRKSFNAQ